MNMDGRSAGSLRAARRRADHLAFTYDHFTGQRTWSDQQLRDAVVDAVSWSEVARVLDCTPDGGSLTRLRTRARRLGVEVGHLERRPVPAEPVPAASIERLRTAAPMLAAAWFTVRGYGVSWPLEPQRYDFVAERDAAFHRVQVKTTTSIDGGSYSVSLTNSRLRGRVTYSNEEIDCFFIVDCELNAYLVPLRVVPGRQCLSLSAYAQFKVMTDGKVLDGP